MIIKLTDKRIVIKFSRTTIKTIYSQSGSFNCAVNLIK